MINVAYSLKFHFGCIIDFLGIKGRLQKRLREAFKSDIGKPSENGSGKPPKNGLGKPPKKGLGKPSKSRWLGGRGAASNFEGNFEHCLFFWIIDLDFI